MTHTNALNIVTFGRKKINKGGYELVLIESKHVMEKKLNKTTCIDSLKMQEWNLKKNSQRNALKTTRQSTYKSCEGLAFRNCSSFTLNSYNK